MNIGGVGGANLFASFDATQQKTGVRAELEAKGGLVQWAKETRWEKLKEKIEREVMADHGVTDADYANMSPQAQTSLKSSLAEEIAKRVKDAMEKARLDSQAEGQPTKAVFVDISV